MADQFGLVTFPIDGTSALVGDPGLQKLGNYLQAVLNAQATTAWGATQPAPPGGQQAVATVYTHSWRRFGFNESSLPALFVWREKGTEEQSSDDWRTDASLIRVLWVPPSLPAEEQRARIAFVNGIMKTVGAFIELGAHPAWVDAGDTDPKAASIAASPNSFVLSQATSLGAVNISGAGLNGARGGAVQSPRLGPTVTTTVATGAYNTTNPIVFTAINWHGDSTTYSVTLTKPNGGETLGVPEDVAQIVSIAVPSMLTTGGTLQFGNAAFTGRGSVLGPRAGFEIVQLWEWEILSIEQVPLDGDQGAYVRLPHDAIAMTVHAREGTVSDLTAYTTAGSGHGVNTTFAEAGLSVSIASWPDRGP